MKWYLDFGHGGKDSGAIGPTNLKESDIALKIGMMVKENLENAFEKVITTRDNDKYYSLDYRTKKANNEKILDMAIDKMYEQIAKVEVERAMEKTRILLGFAPEDYEIKKLKKELGKCEDNKITINPEIVKYNRNIIDYIVLHQYCHLKYKTHSKGFMKMIEKYEPKFEEYEKIVALVK